MSEKLNNLTIHVVNTIPWANLNRDDTGTPKRLSQGGVLRGQLSSQSIKRAIRVDYEAQSLGIGSVRTRNAAELVAEAAARINPNCDADKVKKEATKRIGELFKKGAKEDDADGASVWLSNEEIETAAAVILEAKDSEFIAEGKTGSLAIAAFGRMFAKKGQLNTEAAISVSPAVSTHRAIIESDYFTTVDDHRRAEQGQGSAFLGVAQYTNGVFYRTLTIDRQQLHRAWTGIDRDDARENLEALVTSMVYKLPRGKVKGTAPYTMPQLVLVEEQAYRMAYDFEVPVQPAEVGGFITPTLEAIAKQRAAAMQFDPDNFGSLNLVAGVAPNLDDLFGMQAVSRKEVAAQVADWIL